MVWTSEASRPSEDIWERQRPHIEELYLELPLKTVMTVMKATCDFDASERMYKTRIKKWKLRKYGIKEDGMPAAGRASKRNRLIRAVALDNLQRQRSARADAETALVQNPRSINTPPRFELPERIVSSINDYYGSSFERKIWLVGSSSKPCVSSKGNQNGLAFETLHGSVWTAFEAFKAGDMGNTQKLWTTVSAAITDVIRTEDPQLLSTICLLADNLKKRQWFEVARAVLKQCSEVAEALFGTQNHPLFRIFGLIAYASDEDFSHMLYICWRGSGSMFEKFLGDTHYTSLMERTRIIRKVPGPSSETKLSQMLELSQKCQDSYDPFDPRVLDVGQEYAKMLWQTDNLVEAVAEAEKLCLLVESNPHRNLRLPPDCQPYIYEILFVSSSCYGTLGDLEAEEKVLRRRVRIATMVWGWNSWQAIESLVRVEVVLRERGKFEAAAEVKEQRILAQDAAALE